jgi:hypothetical protein
MSTPPGPVTSWGTEAARLAAKVEALDRLAQDLATTPGERSNAAAAAARLRKRLPEDDGLDLLMAFAALVRATGPSRCTTEQRRPRCIAAYPSGSRCPRQSVIEGMCRKCFRRGAPVWTKQRR